MSVLKIKDQNNNWIQIPTIKGEKGDPFTYADFTPEQLESLKGKDGISPTVSVASDTSDDYRLSFTDETHTVTTPNLIPEAEKIFDVYPHDTASGSIASFPDGADNIPLKSCIVRVEPVQDLHGYDSPWPAGGGKNKLEVTSTSATQNGVTITVNSDGTISLSGTATDQVIFGVGSVALSGKYILSGCPSGGSYSTYFLFCVSYDYGSGETVTLDGTSKSVQIYVRSGVNTNGLVFKPMIRLASDTDATYSPYSNICPISGWTGCEVQRTGKNLYDFADIPIAANVQENIDLSEYINLKAGTYTLSYTLDKTVTATRNRPAYITSNGRYIYSDSDIKTAGRGSWTFTLASDTTLKFFWWNHTVSEACTLGDIQRELGSTATDYEPYTGHTYPITFPSEAGTVYGGYIDPINGDIVADMAIKTTTWGEMELREETETSVTKRVKLDFIPVIGSRTKHISNVAPYSTQSVLPRFTTTKTGYANFMFELNAAPSDTDIIQVCYELAEPIHYPLTPTEIKTLLGQNNLWADTGDTEVEYRADVTKYIDRKITEAVSALT